MTESPQDEIGIYKAPRLAWPQWIVVALLLASVHALLPAWNALRMDAPGSHYRLPYANSDDYWLSNRHIADTDPNRSAILLGDSVIWGEYVPPNGTLSAALTESQTGFVFVNGGANGMHPLALAGLIRCHLPALHGRRIVLHCNLLWLSSARRDLSFDGEISFNHPTLVPQIFERPPAYHAGLTDRVGIAVQREFSLISWTNHVRLTCFEGQDFYAWTQTHPTTNPWPLFSRLRAYPPPQPSSRHPTGASHRPKIPPQDFDWVNLQDSRQWLGFQQAVAASRRRSANVFVIVGPFNQHILTAASRVRFEQRKAHVIAWLREQEIPFACPKRLPADQYADASHPYADGYRDIARQLMASDVFQDFLRP